MTPEQQAFLRAPFAPEQIGKLPRRQNGNTVFLDFVGHAAVTNRLLEVDPHWSWEPMATEPSGLPMMDRADNIPIGLWIRLTICGVTRIGYGSVSGEAFDPEKQLIGDALRNAAMRFGVGLDLWAKEDLGGGEPHASAPVMPRPQQAPRPVTIPQQPQPRPTPPPQPATAPRQQAPVTGVDYNDSEPSLFERAQEAVNRFELNPGDVSPILRDTIGSGQFNPKNIEAWCASTGREPEDLVEIARDVKRHAQAMMRS